MVLQGRILNIHVMSFFFLLLNEKTVSTHFFKQNSKLLFEDKLQPELYSLR